MRLECADVTVPRARPAGALASAVAGVAAGVVIGGVAAALVHRRATADGRSTPAADPEAVIRSRHVATIAHDLRSPLTTVKGVAAILRQRRDLVPPEQVDAMLASVERQADRLNRLADDLLHVVEGGGGLLVLRPEPVDVAVLLTRIAADAAAGSGSDVRVDPGDAGVVMADPARLERAVWNLVANALAHGRPPVEVAAGRLPDGGVRISVTDRGPGLSPAARARLSARSRTGPDPAGAGLGLMIVRQLVDAHGGTVTYRDAGPGACVIIELPGRAGSGPGVGPARE